MMPHPTKFSVLSLLFFVFFILNSCTKDSDILKDAVLQDPLVTLEEQTGENPDETTQPESAVVEEGFESRTTTFYPVEDAYLDSESGELFNQEIIRLSEGQRESFMLFDLSPINDIGGYITSAKLQFTVVGDEGNGTITAFKAVPGDWTEDSAEINAVPDTDITLGAIDKEYKMNAAQELTLTASDLTTERTTLILKHDTGDDLAIASKEHTSKIGPKLVITYNAPQDAEAVITVEEEVKLTAQGSGTTAATTNKSPISIADANVTRGGVPLTVKFTGSNSMDDNKIVKYIWDFRDGSPKSFEANPTHTFKKVGTYKVVLIVKDGAGLTDIDPIYITVNDNTNQAPVAKASGTPLTGPAPLNVSFTGKNSTDDNAVTRYKWVFGDGTISADANPQHTFKSAGTYNVKLVVFDAQGLRHATFLTVNATAGGNKAPVAVAKANPTQGIAPLTVAFNAGSSTDDQGITGYKWDFGDGRAATAKNPTRIYNNPGVYQVKLTVTDGKGLTSTDNVTITVDGASGGGGSDDGGDGGDGGSSGPSDIPAGAVKASSFGFKVGDATSAFEKAISSNNSVIVIDKQSTDWIVRPTRLFNVSNKTIIFAPGVVVRAKTGAYGGTTDILLDLYNPRNVHIEGYDATIRMNKNEYTSGEFRHALKIQGGTNCSIKGLKIFDTGGDGINISAGPKGYSENITVEDVFTSNTRRNGLTIVSGKDIFIRNSTFEKSNGTMPESGLDIEPDHASDRLVNINITNCKFLTNDSAGVQIGMDNMNSSSIPISVIFKNCEFANNGIHPNKAGKPATELWINQGGHDRPVGGTILFQGITFKESKKNTIAAKKSDKAFFVTFKDCQALNVVKDNVTAAIDLKGMTFTNDMGGFMFDNFYMEYGKNQPFMALTCPKGNIPKNIKGNFTIKEPYDNSIEWNNNASPSTAQNCSIQYKHIN